MSEYRKSIKPQDLVYIEEDSDEEKGELRADGGDNDYDLDYVPNSTLNSNETKPKKNYFVKYMLGDRHWKEAKVLSVQPKQTGKYRDWINVHVTGEEDPICVNWDDVELWSELPYPDEVILLTKDGELAQEIVDAKEKEINNLTSNDVYEVIPYSNQKTLSSRWAGWQKQGDHGDKIAGLSSQK